MPDKGRAVSTVADVTLALLLFVAAVGILVTYVGASEEGHEPIRTEYTAQSVVASTMNVTYSLEPAIRAQSESDVSSVPERHPDDDGELRRISHGPIASHLADIVVTGATFDGQQLSKAAVNYQQVVEQTLRANLDQSSHRTNVQAFWTPVEGIDIRGEVELGWSSPPHEDVSVSTVTVPSGIPPVRAEVIDAVDSEDEFDVVAELVATAVIDGYVPTLESQRALESGGVDYELTASRYRRLATIIRGATPATLVDDGWLSPPTADADSANEYLSTELADQLESRLRQTFDDAHRAAQAVSTGEVTITIRTWTDD